SFAASSALEPFVWGAVPSEHPGFDGFGDLDMLRQVSAVLVVGTFAVIGYMAGRSTDRTVPAAGVSPPSLGTAGRDATAPPELAGRVLAPVKLAERMPPASISPIGADDNQPRPHEARNEKAASPNAQTSSSSPPVVLLNPGAAERSSGQEE